MMRSWKQTLRVAYASSIATTALLWVLINSRIRLSPLNHRHAVHALLLMLLLRATECCRACFNLYCSAICLGRLSDDNLVHDLRVFGGLDATHVTAVATRMLSLLLLMTYHVILPLVLHVHGLFVFLRGLMVSLLCGSLELSTTRCIGLAPWGACTIVAP